MKNNSAIKVIARSTIKNNCMDEAIKLYRLLVEETRKEQGCISYELFNELGNENNITLIEEWESLEDLNKHTKTTHFIELVNKLSEIETEAPVLIYKKIL